MSSGIAFGPNPVTPRAAGGKSLAPVLGLTLLSMLSGLAAAMGSPILVASFVGLAGLLILFAIPLQPLILLLFALSFVVTGLIGYFGKINQIYWLPYLIGLYLFVALGMALLSGKARRQQRGSLLIWLVGGYMGLMLLSAVVNLVPMGQILVALKNYLFFWSLFLVFAFADIQARLFERLWKGLLVVAFIQLPIAVLQFTRAGAHAWDAVSGSFGGTETGGASGTLGLVMTVAMVLALALRQARLLGTRAAALILFVCFVPVALAEVKAAIVIFLPAALVLFYWPQIKKNPTVFLGLTALMGALIVGLFALYQSLHYAQVSSASTRQSGMAKLCEAIEQETDPAHVRLATGEMGRTAILVFWWREQRLDAPDKFLFGHGPGSLRVSSFYVGDVAMKYRNFKMDRHAAAFLLWDFGILGLALLLAILATGARWSFRLARSEAMPALHRAYLRTGAVTLVLLLLSLFYMRAVVDSPAGLMLMLICLGQAAYWRNRIQKPRGATPARRPA